MADFEWIATTQRSDKKNTRIAVEADLAQHAGLLARLGYPKKVIEGKLKARLAFDYERIGKAAANKRVGKLVSVAVKLAGN